MIIIVFIVISLNRRDSSPMDIFRILTLQLNTGNHYTGWGHDIFPVGPIWTIAVEFQFYLIFPFLVLFLFKNGRRQLFLILCFFIILKFLIFQLKGDIYSNFYHSIIGRIDQFLVGMILGSFYISNLLRLDNNIKCTFLFLTSVIMLLISFKLSEYMFFRNVFSFFIEVMGWSGIIASFLFFKVRNLLLIKLGSCFACLGSCSFSMYLLHLPIGIAINSIFNLADPINTTESIVQTCFRLLFIIPLAWLSYVAIEKPFMSLRVKYLKLEDN